MKLSRILLLSFVLVPWFSAAWANKSDDRLKFRFSPNEKERAVFTYNKLAVALPNFPDEQYIKKDSEAAYMALYKAASPLPDRVYYVAYYYQPESKCFSWGATLAILQIRDNKIIVTSCLVIDPGGYAGLDFLKLTDFDDDGYIDLFYFNGQETVRRYHLIKNNYGEFASEFGDEVIDNRAFDDDVIYFLKYIDHKEYPIDAVYPRKVDLVDLDKDKKDEMIVETEKFKRIYKWNGEVFVLQSKKPITH